MASVASTTFAETRAALQRHWPELLSVTFVALIPLWIGLFVADIFGFVVLPFVAVALYVHIRQAVDPTKEKESLFAAAQRYISTALVVLLFRAIMLVAIAQLFAVTFGQTGAPVPRFGFGGAVPLFDVRIAWEQIVGLVLALPFSSLPVLFTSIVAASEGFGPKEALKQNYRLWRNAPLAVTVYTFARFFIIGTISLGVLAVWLWLDSVAVAAILTVILAPALYMVLSVYHFYYYTDLIMRA